MNKIETLIKELCPNGVEWKVISDVFNIRNGYTPRKNIPEFWDVKKASIPWFRMEDIRENGSVLSYSIQKITIEAVKGELFPANSILLSTSATIGEHALVTVDHLSNQRFTNLSLKQEFVNKIDMKWFYYYMFIIDEWCKTNTSVSSFPTVDMGGFKKIKIPVPPLEIQKEIVKILDKFTDYVTGLTTELTTELTICQKQYNYYRDKLLLLDKIEVELVKLSKICKIYDGTHQTPKYTNEGVPFVSVENIKNLYSTLKHISNDDYKKFKIKPKINDIFMTRIGDVGTCTVVDRDEDLAYYVSLALIRPDTDYINPYYLKYYIESTLGRRELNKRILHTAVPIKINMGDIGKIMIPLPSLEIQNRVVKVLDNFETIINDISNGLPKEIELRQKQYEYYRDKLLSVD
ncbi:restriction endonuclease subunit S [Streptococcus sp. FSL R7-0212]|uniref:restriction endonuclease subunit S n=1 Tax=Streptococcus sp. FSL R7-0212 TaxID=2921726 RepID=UPI0030F50593